MALSYEKGYQAGKEDFAIGAKFGVPDETLGNEYRVGYTVGWYNAEGESKWGLQKTISEEESRSTYGFPPMTKEYPDGDSPKPKNVIVKFETMDGSQGIIDFAGDLEVASTIVGIAIRTGIFPAVQWSIVGGAGIFQSFGVRGPFRKMEIEFK